MRDETAAPPPSGTRVRAEIPRRRVAVLAVHDLAAAGDRERGASAVRGVEFEVEAGTMALLTPAAPGRTVVLCLAGELQRSGGSTETGPLSHRVPLETTSWRLVVAGGPDLGAASGESLVQAAGPAARRAAGHLGLGPHLETRVADLAPPRRTLLGLATALRDDPDLVTLDDPAADLTDLELVEVIDAVRGLVDVDGRTVIVTGDLADVPAALRPLFDQVVDLTPTLPDPTWRQDASGPPC